MLSNKERGTIIGSNGIVGNNIARRQPLCRCQTIHVGRDCECFRGGQGNLTSSTVLANGQVALETPLFVSDPAKANTNAQGEINTSQADRR